MGVSAFGVEAELDDLSQVEKMLEAIDGLGVDKDSYYWYKNYIDNWNKQ